MEDEDEWTVIKVTLCPSVKSGELNMQIYSLSLSDLWHDQRSFGWS